MEGLAATYHMKRKAEVTSSNATGAQSVSPWIDAFSRRRQPTSRELLRENKGTAYSCIWLNSNTQAMYPPQVYIKTTPGLPVPKCIPREDLWDIAPLVKKAMEAWPYWRMVTKTSKEQFGLPVHPIHDLFMRANRWQSGFNFWALMGQYIEVFGLAYVWIKFDEWTGVPMELRILPTQDVEPKYENWTVVDPWDALTPNRYQVKMQANHRYAQFDLTPAEVIEVRMEDLANPFRGGRSSHHASFENTTLQSEYIAHRQALYENRARPDCIVSPATGEYIGVDELSRLRKQWMQEYGRGGSGLPHFAQTPLRVDILGFAESQVALLSEHGATKEDILNGFGVPVSFYTRETNMANLQASTEYYMRGTIRPRIYRRDHTFTQRLCSLYDPTGALFLSSEDPVPEDLEAKARRQEADLKSGKRSINEVREEDGMPPVDWGETPWLPTYFAPVDMNMIWEVRRDLRLAQNDPASALMGARTRSRPEDVNADKPMKSYSHAGVHGAEQDAGEKAKEKDKKDREKGSNGKVDKSLPFVIDKMIEHGANGKIVRVIEEHY